jgi:hypothetical protein
MKLLLEKWNRYLNEGIDPRIQKQLDELVKTDVGIVMTKMSGDWGEPVVRFMYNSLDDLGDEFGTTSDGSEPILPHGEIHIVEAEGDQGRCLDGWIVDNVEALQGWGPLLYEVALEWASQNGGGLTSGREEVSDFAEEVWKKYLVRTDVKKDQLDILAVHGLPQLTPNYWKDDCLQSKALATGGDDGWADTPFAKMYSKPNTEVTNALKAAGRFVEK